MEISVLDQKGEVVGKVELPEKVFGVKSSAHLLHEAATIYLANQRQGDAHTKTRAEVSGGGRKPWKQKHTGRARHGSIRSPLWRKGGVVFGPRRHSYRQDMPSRKGRLALAHALSARAKSGDVRIIDGFACAEPKTKIVAKFLKALKVNRRALLVVDQMESNLTRASKNLQELCVVLTPHLNAYEVMACEQVIMTRGSLEKLTSTWN